jgi:hypothetical protein
MSKYGIRVLTRVIASVDSIKSHACSAWRLSASSVMLVQYISFGVTTKCLGLDSFGSVNYHDDRICSTNRFLRLWRGMVKKYDHLIVAI